MLPLGLYSLRTLHPGPCTPDVCPRSRVSGRKEVMGYEEGSRPPVHEDLLVKTKGTVS